METLSNEINMRFSHEMYSLMSMMHSQINRAINSAINDRIIPEIQNIMGSLSEGHRDTDSGKSGTDQESSEQLTALKSTNLKRPKSAPYLRLKKT